MPQRIILASTSPRRKEIMEKTRLTFEVVPSDYQEDMTLKMKPEALAKYLSKGKALAVAQNYKNAIVIGADTFVVYKDHLLGKPKSKEEAREMLKKLSGKTHSLLTGLAVIDTASGKTISKVEEVKVFFKKITDSDIEKYIATGEPMDKAGAYALQGYGAVFIKKIEGDFFSAMGLPLNILADILKKLGVEVL